MPAKLDAHNKKMMARMDSQLEKMEATYLETNPEATGSKAKQEEVPEEEAIVETFGAPKERYGDWHLAIRCSGQPKKQTEGHCGSWNKLAAAQGH
jgi:hypothetical protein